MLLSYLKMVWLEFVVISGLWLTVSSEYCVKENIDICSQPLEKYGLGKYHAEDNLKKAFPIARFSKEEIQDICLLYNGPNGVWNCLNDIIPNCDKQTKIVLKGAKVAFKFLCGKGLDDFLQNKACFDKHNDQLGADWKGCLHDLTNLGAYYTKSDVCEHVDDYNYCVKHAAEIRCGQDAGEFADKFNKNVLQPATDLADCNELSTTVIYIIIGLSVAMFATIVSVVQVYCCNKRRTATSGASGDNSGSDLPYRQFNNTSDYPAVI